MNISLSFIRLFFILISILFATTYTTALLPGGLSLLNVLLGIIGGGLFGGALVASDTLFKKFNLRSFNIAVLGLLFGYLMGEAIMLVFNTALQTSNIGFNPEALGAIRIAIFLFCTYLGMVMTARASEEINVSIPFIKFKPTTYKKKDILLDISILQDSRIIDLAASGILDHNLILPRFTLKEIQSASEGNDETAKSKARRHLDVLKKLENIPTLDLRFVDTDFPEAKDPMAKLVRLARFLDANILTADISRIQQSTVEGIRIINIHSLSNALKPITQTGECINIKIQRYGKEARQGVGYLDDGTMVVVNGGAEFIGETIKAQVLSVKHTSSGRMIFCNAFDAHLSEHDLVHAADQMENNHKSYFAMYKNEERKEQDPLSLHP